MSHEFRKNKLFGFLTVISPPEPIMSHINHLKQGFYEKYGHYNGRFSKPHITICNFPLLSQRIEKVFSSLKSGLSELSPFQIQLNGFKSFKNSNVIYIDIENSKQLMLFRKKLIYMNVDLRLGKRFFLFDNPHLTIAKNLPNDIFESAKIDFLSRSFQSQFIVDKLTVLRYDLDEEKYFHFCDLPFGE